MKTGVRPATYGMQSSGEDEHGWRWKGHSPTDAGVERICRSAPHLIVTHAPADERTAPIAAATALTYIELTAYAFGLGACWAGYFARASNDWPPMKEALKLPDGHVNLGTMMIGYPAFGYQRIPLRKEAEIEWR